MLAPRQARQTHRILTTSVALAAALTLTGCGEEEGGELTQDDTTPIVGVLELPLSHRASAPAPASAARVEVTPSELRLDYQTVTGLSGGTVPEASVSNHIISPLREQLSGGPSRAAAIVRLHANTPFATLTQLLATLEDAGIRQIAFEVRPIQNPTSTGMMVLDDFEVREASDEPVTFEGPRKRRWEEFVAGWEATYEGCRRDHYVDCASPPAEAAAGGEVAITLFARGSALRAEFQQVGGEDPAPEGASAGPELLDGVPAPAGEVVQEGPPPADHGTFTWRFEGATADLSPIKDAFRPLCGARPCGVSVTGDATTLAMRLLSFLGAAFPDGSEAPAVVFVHPE